MRGCLFNRRVRKGPQRAAEKYSLNYLFLIFQYFIRSILPQGEDDHEDAEYKKYDTGPAVNAFIVFGGSDRKTVYEKQKSYQCKKCTDYKAEVK